jgi:hypothetical protein
MPPDRDWEETERPPGDEIPADRPHPLLIGLKGLFSGSSRLSPLIETAAHLATAITLVLLLLQFWQGEANERRQRALGYVHDYNANPVSGYRLTIAKAWLPQKERIDALNRGDGLSREEIDELARHVIGDHDSKYPNESGTLAIQAVADFYDQVALCVKKEVCDREIVATYFEPGVSEFWKTHQAVIKDLRPSMAPHLGKNLEEIFIDGDRD